MIPIRAESSYTSHDRAQMAQYVAPRRILTGSHISDLAELRKAIIFCPSCQHKFDAKRYDYVVKWHRVQGPCDGCHEHTPMGSLLVHGSMPR